jgi:hypothetical protein
MIRLARRERWLVIGLVIVLVWALFALGIKPALGRIETLKRVIPEKQKALQELRAESSQYLTFKKQMDDLKKSAALEEKDFELLTFLEGVNGELNLAQKVTVMKREVLPLDPVYNEVIVETKLENITLQQLVEYLLKIKSSSHALWVRSLYTQRNVGNPSMLDSTIQVSTLKSG